MTKKKRETLGVAQEVRGRSRVRVTWLIAVFRRKGRRSVRRLARSRARGEESEGDVALGEAVKGEGRESLLGEGP